MSLLSRLKSLFSVKDTSIVLPTDISLLESEGFTPDNFEFGIEIYNDNTTPMEFVVSTLIDNLKIKKNKAIELMLTIHTKGGVIVQLESIEEAKKIAKFITSEAQKQNHTLVCRAISAQQGTQVDG